MTSSWWYLPKSLFNVANIHGSLEVEQHRLRKWLRKNYRKVAMKSWSPRSVWKGGPEGDFFARVRLWCLFQRDRFQNMVRISCRSKTTSRGCGAFLEKPQIWCVNCEDMFGWPSPHQPGVCLSTATGLCGSALWPGSICGAAIGLRGYPWRSCRGDPSWPPN